MTAISVIIPCYNTVRHVKAALQSVLFQSHAPLEVICVDDGSDDGSAEAIQEAGFGAGAPVRLITQGRRGAAAARNTGVAAAKGEWLAFLDADDLWPQGSLSARVETQRLSGADMVFGKVAQFIDGEARDLDAGMPGRMAGSMLLRRAAFDRVGPFDEALATAETIDWVARARAAGVSEQACDALVLRRRIHGANTMLVHEGRDRDRLAVLRSAVARKRAGI
jgi:glycosyltransferase involved in cell wall biosynthesis